MTLLGLVIVLTINAVLQQKDRKDVQCLAVGVIFLEILLWKFSEVISKRGLIITFFSFLSKSNPFRLILFIRESFLEKKLGSAMFAKPLAVVVFFFATGTFFHCLSLAYMLFCV